MSTEVAVREFAREQAQEPTVSNVPPYQSTLGNAAIALAAGYGLTADPWQALVVRHFMATKAGTVQGCPAPRWNTLVNGLSIPRQSGKGAVIEIICLYQAVIMGRRILFSAHQFKTAKIAFRRFLDFFDNPRYPELAGQVNNIVKGNAHGIYLKNGGSIEFIARSSNSGRGYTVDTVIYDEAMDISEESIESLQATISSAPSGNPQVLYFGTPPAPIHRGEPFERIRESALAKDAGVCWCEWSATEDGLDADDRLTWARSNPSLATRQDFEMMIAERATYSDDGFKRERLGMWKIGNTNAILDLPTWEKCHDEDSKIGSRRVLAVDVSHDRDRASISVAGIRPDGKYHIELIDSRDGVNWVVPALKNLIDSRDESWWAGVIIDAYSPAKNLIDECKRSDIRVHNIGVKEIIESSQNFVDFAHGSTVFHIGQVQLTKALEDSRKRKVGEAGWAVARATADTDVTPIVSAILALWGAATSKNLKKPIIKRRERKQAIPVNL